MRPPSAEAMEEGDWIVRGTQDPVYALEALVKDDADEQLQFDLQHCPERYPDPEAALNEWCYEKLARARPGVWRKVHCLPSSYGADNGWGWELHEAARKPGAFDGVYFL